MKTLCFICTNFSTNTLHTWPTYRFFLYNCSSPKSIEKLIWLGSRTICINVDSHSLCRFSILYGGGGTLYKIPPLALVSLKTSSLAVDTDNTAMNKQVFFFGWVHSGCSPWHHLQLVMLEKSFFVYNLSNLNLPVDAHDNIHLKECHSRFSFIFLRFLTVTKIVVGLKSVKDL